MPTTNMIQWNLQILLQMHKCPYRRNNDKAVNARHSCSPLSFTFSVHVNMVSVNKNKQILSNFPFRWQSHCLHYLRQYIKEPCSHKVNMLHFYNFEGSRKYVHESTIDCVISDHYWRLATTEIKNTGNAIPNNVAVQVWNKFNAGINSVKLVSFLRVEQYKLSSNFSFHLNFHNFNDMIWCCRRQYVQLKCQRKKSIPHYQVL